MNTTRAFVYQTNGKIGVTVLRRRGQDVWYGNGKMKYFTTKEIAIAYAKTFGEVIEGTP